MYARHVVRGRWHFRALFLPFVFRRAYCSAPWHHRTPRIYAGVMNEAIRSGSETQAVATPALSVIIPTFNERDNVVTLFQRLTVALAGVSWEAIFVDDNSPDGTADAIRTLALQDSRARCIRRVGRRGLS